MPIVSRRSLLAGALGLLPSALPARAADPVIPLPNAHAHNDYEHPRPLLDALDHGFCSVEADIFLVDGKLLVGHTRDNLRPERTLEALYLEPLRKRVRENGGRLYRNGPRAWLLIDCKTDGEALYPVLRETLARYPELFTVSRGDKMERKALTAVLSGEAPRKSLLADKERYAGLDGRFEDLPQRYPAATMPWVSAAWDANFLWRGEGPFPEAQREKLRDMVRRAHAQGHRVRFWASPDRPEVWKEQLDAGVDLLSVDDLAGLQKFLIGRAADVR